MKKAENAELESGKNSSPIKILSNLSKLSIYHHESLDLDGDWLCRKFAILS